MREQKKKKRLSIRRKLILTFGLILGISSIGTNITTSMTIVKIMESGVEEKLVQITEELASAVDSRLEAKIEVLQTLARREEFITHDVHSSEVKQLLSEEAQELGFRNIYIANTEGIMVLESGTLEDVNSDPIYQNAIKGMSTYSEPMTREETTIVNIAVPVKNADGTIRAVLIATQNIHDFSQIVVKGDSTNFMISSSGKILAHFDQTMLLLDFQEEEIQKTVQDNTARNESVMQKMLNNESGFDTWFLETDGSKNYIGYASIESTGWIVAMLEPYSEVQATILKQTATNLIRSGIILGAGLVFVWILSTLMSKNIRKITEHINQLATGDFRTPVENQLKKSTDELGEAATALEQMRLSIAEMVGTMIKGIQVLQKNSNELDTVSRDVAQSSDGIANSTNEMAVGVADQTNDLVNILDVIQDFGHMIEDVIGKIDNVKSSTDVVTDEVKTGNQNAEGLSISVKEVDDSFIEFTARIQELGNRIHNITNITTLIDSIAEQTNLLALNASIEAARAGEAGKGFAVVADEIRKLATECKKSADDINCLIASISSDTEVLISGSESMNQELQGQMDNITHTVESFSTVSSAIHHMLENINSISGLILSLGDRKNAIITRVENATAVGEEITASTQEITASAGCMKQSADSAEETAANLLNVTKQIEQLVERFKI